MAKYNPSNWQSLGGNDPTKYNATFNLNNSQGNKDAILVTTDRATGNYDVYKKTLFGNKLIYQYNASNNNTNIVNDDDYTNYFAEGRTKQGEELSKSVKEATLGLAEDNVSGSTSRKEYQELQEKTGYVSLSNSEQQTTSEDEIAAPLSTSEEEGVTSSAGSNVGGDGGDNSFGNTGGFESIGRSAVDFNNLDGADLRPTPEGIDDAVNAFNIGANLGQSVTDTKLDLNDPFFTRKFGEDGERLIYPEADLTSFGYDYIEITGHKYTTKGTNGFNGNQLNLGSVSEKLGQITKIVQLPMQPNLSEASAVDWTQDEINEIQKRAAGIAAQGITDFRNSKIKDLGGVFANLLGNAGTAAQELIRDNGLAPFITAYFAGQAVGANIVARTTGQVLNKNLELLFKGPKLRQFSFNFTFTPRSNKEAETIRKMIRFFKKSMAPEVSPQSLFLYTPDIFQIKYIHNSGNDHPYLNRFKPCALTNFSANYTPGNSYMTYKDGSMTQYTVTMTFSELEPIYQNDHDGAGGTGF